MPMGATCKIILWLVHHPQTSKSRLAIMNIVHTWVKSGDMFVVSIQNTVLGKLFACNHQPNHHMSELVAVFLLQYSENTLKVSRLCKRNLQSQVSSTVPCLPHFAQSCWPRRHIIKHNHCWCTDTHLYREPCLWNCIEVWSIFGTNWHLKRSWENLEGRLSGPLGSLQSDVSASLPCNPPRITLNAWRDIKIIASMLSSMLSLNVYLHHRITDDAGVGIVYQNSSVLHQWCNHLLNLNLDYKGDSYLLL
jgi:hypothetical protein